MNDLLGLLFGWLQPAGAWHVVVDANPIDWWAVAVTFVGSVVAAGGAAWAAVWATERSREASEKQFVEQPRVSRQQMREQMDASRDLLERQLAADLVARSDDRLLAALADWHAALLGQADAVADREGLIAVREYRRDVETAMARIRFELQKSDETFVMTLAGLTKMMQHLSERLAESGAATDQSLREPRDIVEHLSANLSWSVIGLPRGEWSKKMTLNPVFLRLQELCGEIPPQA